MRFIQKRLQLTGVALSLTLAQMTHAQAAEGWSQALSRWAGGSIANRGVKERALFQRFMKTRLIRQFPEQYSFSTNDFFLNGSDAYVWQFQSFRKSYLVYLNPVSGFTPSAEHAWLFIVDVKGHTLFRSDFDTGWRMGADGATYESLGWSNAKVLVQHMRGEQGPRKIYFAFDGLRPAVVRLEDGSGRLKPMDYFAPNWVVGPHFAPTTIDELLKKLGGKNEVNRNEALVWLAGVHGLASKKQPDVYMERVDQQKLYLKAIKSKKVIAVIKRLRQDRNSYVRQLAERVPIGVGLFDARW